MIPIITDDLLLVRLIERHLKNISNLKLETVILKSAGETLRAMKDSVPSLIILDGDARFVFDVVLIRELFSFQVAGSKIILLKAYVEPMWNSDLPMNYLVSKTEIAEITKIIFEHVKSES